MAERKKLKWGATFIMGNGKNVLFWEDTWVTEVPLKLSFPRIYRYSRKKGATIENCLQGGHGT